MFSSALRALTTPACRSASTLVVPPVIIMDRRDGFGDDDAPDDWRGKECLPGIAEADDE